MTFTQLTKNIKSPITGNTLYLQKTKAFDDDGNYHLAQMVEGKQGVYDTCLAPYMNTQYEEVIYIPFEFTQYEIDEEVERQWNNSQFK